MSIKEKRLKIDCGDIHLESLFHNLESAVAAVITHPHPLFGGSMHNNMVHDAVKAFSSAGLTTLRFNFRGVGSSAGKYNEGIGEREDFLNVYHFLKSFREEAVEIMPVGYSFGSQIIFHALSSIKESCSTILIAPPVDAMDFSPEADLKRHRFFIIVGDNDQHCSPKSAEALAKRLEADLKILTGVDHFFRDKSELVQKEIIRCINTSYPQ